LFLDQVLPDIIPPSEGATSHIRTRELFIEDVLEGMKAAPMSIRLMPHTLASIDWSDPIKDPIRLQFIPMKSGLEQDHFALTLDSLHEKEDSPVDGLVHRYPDKGLFLGKFS
jgi:lysine 2,3-aminomutase